ncbi:MAG: hypothetical protein ACRD3A_13950 [Terriglobales bacterium]
MKRFVITGAFGLICAVALLGLQTSPTPAGNRRQTRVLRCPGIFQVQVANEIGNPLVWVLNESGNLWARAFGGEADAWTPMERREREIRAQLDVASSLYDQGKTREADAILHTFVGSCEYEAIVWGNRNYLTIKLPPLILLSVLAPLAIFRFLTRSSRRAPTAKA